MDKKELEARYRELELEINQKQAKRDNLHSGLKLIQKEIRRIDEKLEELSQEIIFVINNLRKF